MSRENKGVRSEANARSLVENPDQNHDYSADATPCHIPGEFEHKGEDVERTEKASKATAGRHIASTKNGLAVAKERSAYLESARKAHHKSWDSDKLTVVPEQKSRKRK
jgi:hypothetical protein